ncbi:MAG: hypothetical protein MZU91_07190 [Desulfosudis oleivorans]|nr:hypothetical protein [Desulfosudis oleivorans]
MSEDLRARLGPGAAGRPDRPGGQAAERGHRPRGAGPSTGCSSTAPRRAASSATTKRPLECDLLDRRREPR